ncbi:ATP-binding cassette domain-containing protein [Paenibacillus paeoniae]|uniref:ATP-binding cassette domain-containing protein n=1 Tax=Paenibacillus paeoniae TaxID=2292705 RepID=A0A371P6T3_9BACL|nr:ATP-binding cassette domain-containing protein [Paenibacillus paeoniae]
MMIIRESLTRFPWKFQQKKKVAIVGDGKSGKSTIAHFLLRFYEAKQGTIEVINIPINYISKESWSKKLALCFKNSTYFPIQVDQTFFLVGTFLKPN